MCTGKRVLDFGCGVNAWNAISIQNLCLSVDGVDRSLPQSGRIHNINLYQNLDEIQSVNYNVIIA